MAEGLRHLERMSEHAAPSLSAIFAKPWLKPAVFAMCLVPLAALALRAVEGDLGPNPIETVTRTLGDWALRFLLIALAVTPVRLITGWNGIARLRRMLGLIAFFYVCLHMLSYIGLDWFFDFGAIWDDIVKRVYITIGMATFLMLLPLAITSTDAMVRRIGARNWRRLHRLAYVAAVAAVIHYTLMIKAGYAQPVLHAAILAVLLAIRVIFYLRKSR
jgi:sulfoxide reductase heme-binding subunit YedZ